MKASNNKNSILEFSSKGPFTPRRSGQPLIRFERRKSRTERFYSNKVLIFCALWVAFLTNISTQITCLMRLCLVIKEPKNTKPSAFEYIVNLLEY